MYILPHNPQAYTSLFLKIAEFRVASLEEPSADVPMPMSGASVCSVLANLVKEKSWLVTKKWQQGQ